MGKKSAESRLLERPTVPIEQVLSGETDRLTPEYMKLCSQIRPAQDTIPLKLGKQNFQYFNGEFRFCVWENMDGPHPWRLFHHKVKGVCLEVPEGTTVEGAWDSWRDFVRSVT